MKPSAAAGVARALQDMGCYEVSMGDTTGVGTAGSIAALFQVRPFPLPSTSTCSLAFLKQGPADSPSTGSQLSEQQRLSWVAYALQSSPLQFHSSPIAGGCTEGRARVLTSSTARRGQSVEVM